MASSLVNDDDDNASSTTTTSGTATTTRNTQQQSQLHSQQQPNNNNNTNCLKQQQQTNNNNTSTSDSTANSSKGGSKMHGNEAKAKKESLQHRKLELEKLLNEKNWLLQQLQKQESEILNGNFEYMNFNDFIQNLAIQYKQEQQSKDTVSNISGSAGGGSQFSASEEAILRRKPLTAKENQPHHNVLHRRQSEISNRSSEYDNYPQQDNLSTHSEGASSSGVRGVAGAGGSGSMTMQHAQAQQQYNAKSALKKRSATVAGTTQQSAANLQMIRQHHLDQQLIQDHQQRVQKQQQQQQQQQHMLYKQQHYHHPQQHLFKQHLEHHQVLMPHLQYATQKFYYTTLQPTQPTNNPSSSSAQQQQPQPQSQQQHQPAQPQYGRYIKAQPQQLSQLQLQSQAQHHHLTQNPQQQLSPNHYNSSSATPTNHHQQSLLMTPPPHGSAVPSHMDNISLYSLNSNNVATLHRQAQQQQPIIVQCDKYYLSPTTHHVSHNDGGGFIKSSQNIKEYISPMNSPQQLMAREREKRLASQTNLSQRGVTATPSIDNISLAPSYVSMETVDYTTSQQQLQQNQLRWRSQTNLPPSSSANLTMVMNSNEIKSYSSDMLNNNQYYNTAINPPPPVANAGSSHALPPNVTQVKPFKPLDEISINSYSTETQKKSKSKQWLESSLDGPVIRQTHHNEDNDYINNNNSTGQQRSKLSSHSLNTSRHYSMSAATQAKPITSTMASSQAQTTKLSQSTSYLNQIETTGVSTTPLTPPSISQAYNVETTSPSHNPMAYKFLPVSNNQKPPARPPLYINATSTTCGSPTTGLLSGVSASSSALSPDIRVESPKNVTVVQPATFQPYKEVTKPFEMSDFYKYSTKYRQKENQAAQQSPDN